MEPLYKVGDKVIIVKPPPDQLDRCWLLWDSRMDSYIGTQAEIRYVSKVDGTYKINGCDDCGIWWWHESWLIQCPDDPDDNLLCGDLESLL